MFLKRALLHGFKSFADRTEFEFGPGITSIVGPNGCGKSNLLDAIRWVLGEQSPKSLRGDRMLDVIFSGSKSRKAGNFAEVVLTFDNSRGILRTDTPEVSVGRVLYRSGESEYRLNGHSCRLKDIRELLLDTGVGVDAYSVIEQGRVDQLLQASPAERREIFEEAAGISRYKMRRIEAQRRLERTRENLLRLGDVVEELERRLRSVKLAAGKARSFLELDEKLRERRSTFAMAEYHGLEAARAAQQGECDALSDALQEERARLAGLDASAAELAEQLQIQDDRIQAEESTLAEARASLSALQERIVQTRRRISELETSQRRSHERLRAMASNREDLELRHASAIDDLEDARRAESRLDGEVQTLQTSRQELEQKLAAARSALERERAAAYEAARRASLLQSEIAGLDTQQQRVLATMERLAARQTEIATQRANVESRLADLATDAQQLEETTRAQAEQVRADEREQAALSQEASELDAAITAAKEMRSALLSRLALLEDLDRKLEGVDAGTRQALQAGRAGKIDGVLGLVGELLRIDDPRVGALQPILSTFETHLVVRDGDAFVTAVVDPGPAPESLRLVALNRLPDKPIAAGYESTPGFVARGSDWVVCDEALRPLADQLLGRVIVVDTLERALHAAREALAGYVFATLDGWCIGSDGRITHGTTAAAAGLISRKAEIRLLRTNIEEAESDLALRTRRRLEVDRALSDLLLRKQATMEQLARLQRRDAELRGETARATDERDRLDREARLVDLDLTQHRRQADEQVQSLARLREQSTETSEEQRGREAGVDRYAQDVRELDVATGRVRQELTAAEVARGRAVERRAAMEQSIADVRSRLEGLARDAERLEHEIADARQQADAASEEIRAAELEQATAQDQVRLREGEILALRAARTELKGELERCGVDVREAQRRVEAGETTLHEKQMALRELEVRKDALVVRVRDELSIDLGERYATYEHSEQDWDAVRAEIEELKGKISRLGNVNLDALQELDELMPRYEHLTGQRRDLEESIQRLEELIATLDAESKSRFSTAFAQIRENFQDLFRKLFGGGKADILLEDESNPLECGIEIIARPPGKEPQTIGLLSGGERTMTAVALLMAVFRSRPSPFAILDEVDAALDEANTDRFNRVLQEFLSHSQFVVITHSKRTMSSADVLYGVTMEEPGVSKRVSVRFEKERVSTPVGA